jgi:sugar (pentulose or hexulose) kinase
VRLFYFTKNSFHQLPHLYRAILEGVAFEQRLNTLGVERALGQAVTRYIAIGGGAQSNLWCQIIADITNKPVFRATSIDAAALGAGILAATAAGCYGDARQAAQEMTHILHHPIEPDASRLDFYNRLFEEVYQPLFPALQPYLGSAGFHLEFQSARLKTNRRANGAPRAIQIAFRQSYHLILSLD